MKTDFKISGSFNLSHYGHLTWRRKPLGRRLCSEFVLKIHIFRVYYFFLSIAFLKSVIYTHVRGISFMCHKLLSCTLVEPLKSSSENCIMYVHVYFSEAKKKMYKC